MSTTLDDYRPEERNIDLSVAGGLLDLMMRCQDGRCTCMYAAHLIELLHERAVARAMGEWPGDR